MRTHSWIYLPLLLSASLWGNAQDSTASSKSYFKAGLSYLADNVYLGRKDSVATPYLSPTVGYYHKSGLYLTASVAYLPTESRYDNLTFGGGYTYAHNQVETEVAANKYYYSAQSYSVKSEMEGDASASFAYDFGCIKPTAQGSLTFSKKTDYAASFGVEHAFSFSSFTLAPALLANASTQNAYNAYYQKRKYIETKKGKRELRTITANAAEVTRFKLMDYELSAPLEYEHDKLALTFTPTFAMPVNPNTIYYSVKTGTAPPVNRSFVESLGPTLFWSLGAEWQF